MAIRSATSSKFRTGTEYIQFVTFEPLKPWNILIKRFVHIKSTHYFVESKKCKKYPTLQTKIESNPVVDMVCDIQLSDWLV